MNLCPLSVYRLWNGLAGVRASDDRRCFCRPAARPGPKPLGDHVRHDRLRLVVPWALVFGPLRGIPFFWRLIDCSFGVFGIVPLWLCRRDIDMLERLEASARMKPFLLSLLTGLLFAFSLPPYNWEWLGWFAFVPLFVGGAGAAAFGGCRAGNAGRGSLRRRAGWLVSRHVAAVLGLYSVSLAVVFVRRCALAAAKVPASWNPIAASLFIASVGVGGEWLTSFLPLPLNIALCQYRNLPLDPDCRFHRHLGRLVSALVGERRTGRSFCSRRFAPAGIGLVAGRCCRWAMVYYARVYGSSSNPVTPTLNVAAIQDLTGEEVGDLAAPRVAN